MEGKGRDVIFFLILRSLISSPAWPMCRGRKCRNRITKQSIKYFKSFYSGGCWIPGILLLGQPIER